MPYILHLSVHLILLIMLCTSGIFSLLELTEIYLDIFAYSLMLFLQIILK
jgi:hypothetical protein